MRKIRFLILLCMSRISIRRSRLLCRILIIQPRQLRLAQGIVWGQYKIRRLNMIRMRDSDWNFPVFYKVHWMIFLTIKLKERRMIPKYQIRMLCLVCWVMMILLSLKRRFMDRCQNANFPVRVIKAREEKLL